LLARDVPRPGSAIRSVADRKLMLSEFFGIEVKVSDAIRAGRERHEAKCATPDTAGAEQFSGHHAEISLVPDNPRCETRERSALIGYHHPSRQGPVR